MTNSVFELRRQNLARLLKESGAKTALAVKLDMTPAQISHWLRNPKQESARLIHEESARAIEKVIGLAPGELDRDPDTPRPAAQRPVNADLLTETTRFVLSESRAGKNTPLEKVADIVTLAYAHAVEHGRLDEAYVRQLIRLMH